MKKAIISFMVLLGASSLAFCAQEDTPEYTEGINFSNPRENTTPSPYMLGPSGANMQSEMSRLKNTITADPQIMQIVTGLMTDPQFQEIMQDPQIVNAAKSGDIQTLMSNPKFMSVVNNPKIGEINNRIRKQEQR